MPGLPKELLGIEQGQHGSEQGRLGGVTDKVPCNLRDLEVPRNFATCPFQETSDFVRGSDQNGRLWLLTL